MKNILFVIDSLSCGGAEKSLISLLSLLDYSKYAVDLLLFKRGGHFEQFLPRQVNILHPLKYAEFLNLPLYRAFAHALRRMDFTMLYARIKHTLSIRIIKGKIHGSQLFWKNISQTIEKNPQEYDVAIAFSQGFPTYYVADKVTAGRKVAWLNTDYKQAGYREEIDRKFYDRMDYISVVSEDLITIMTDCYPNYKDKIIYMEDLINPQLIFNLGDSSRGFDDNYEGVRILTVGRLVPHKGYDIAVKACKELKNKNIDFRWYVIGEGPSRNSIEQMIRKYGVEREFKLLGFKINPYPYMKQCDVYVQTSKVEGKPLAIREAQIFAKPVITTNYSTANSHLQHGVDCLIVDMDAVAVCNAIRKMLNDCGLRHQIIAYLNNHKKGNVEVINNFYNLVEAK